MPPAVNHELNDPRNFLNSEDASWQQGIYDFFPGLVYVYDLDKKELRYINKKITDTLGFSYDDVKDWKQDLGKLVFKDDIELVNQELEKFHSLKENEAHGYECRLNRKEGDYIHFQVTGKVLRRNAAGNAESVILVAQDISKQVRMADDARAFREMMDDTENLLQFASWRWDAATGKEKWSKGVYALLNYTQEDAESKMSSLFFLEHVLPDDRKRIDDLYFQAIDHHLEFLSYEFRLKTHDGQIKIIHSNIKFRYADDLLIGALGINRDVTDKSTLLNNLLGYREMILAKEKFLEQGTWEMDLESGITIWSEGMYKLYGYDPTEAAALISGNDIHHKHMTEERNRLANPDQEDTFVWQYEITTRNGEIKQLETFGRVFRDAAGKAVKIIGTTRDVTTRLKHERELDRRIAELRRSNKDLEDFAYIASHDMHEPLRKVHSFADRLKTKYGTGMDEEAVGYLDRILAATQNARMMIDGLMEFSRLARNGFRYENVNLGEVVAEVLGDIELKVEETETQLEIGNLPRLEAVRTQMKQLFSNIILNAIKFRRADVTPLLKIQAVKLTRAEEAALNLDRGTSYQKVTISDNGIGFEEEYAETIFQMFQRLNSKKDYPGSGIGLALCKKIAENHNGLIKASSSPGNGAVFTVILPETHKA